jgi:uncharacterized membrane protein
MVMRSNNAATLLRWGIAFVFFYGAIATLLWPDRSLVHIPELWMMLVPGRTLLVIFSVYELALSGVLFWGKKIAWSSLLAAITFAAIVVIDFQYMAFVFPFIGLALASLALLDMSKQNIKIHEQSE